MQDHEHNIKHLQSVLGWILRMDTRFIVVDLTLAPIIPGMEQLIPLGEQSRERAFAEAASHAQEVARHVAASHGGTKDGTGAP